MCDALAKPICVELAHKTCILLEEAQKFQIQLEKILKGLEKGDTIRGRVDGVLQVKLKTFETQIVENRVFRQKIRAAIASCQEMAKLSPEMKVSAVIQKKLKEMKKEMQGAFEQARKLFDHAIPTQTKVNLIKKNISIRFNDYYVLELYLSIIISLFTRELLDRPLEKISSQVRIRSRGQQ